MRLCYIAIDIMSFRMTKGGRKKKEFRNTIAVCFEENVINIGTNIPFSREEKIQQLYGVHVILIDIFS